MTQNILVLKQSQKPSLNDLLPILQEEIGGDLIQTVNARNLHSELGIKKDFSDWVKAQIKRGQLIENADYLFFPQKGENSGRGRSSIEYHMALDAAKSIAMMSGGEKGNQVRRYFIECEKQLRQQVSQVPDFNDPVQAARAWADELEQKQLAQQENAQLTHQVEEMQPKAAALDRISAADGSLCVRDAAKILKVRPKDLTRWLNQNQWIYKRPGNAAWIGYQHRIQQGLLKHNMVTIHREDGSEKTCTQVRVTSKGLTKLSTVFSSEEELA